MFLNKIAQERSTFVVSLSFEDENGISIIPDSLTWSLFDKEGGVINSRLNVVINTPTEITDIFLNGDDLQLSNSESELRVKRFLVAEAIYTATNGNPYPIKDEIIFFIENLKV